MVSSGYTVVLYRDERTGRVPVLLYMREQSEKVRARIGKYIQVLAIRQGYLEEPLSRHIDGPIRELRVDFARGRHRIFYFAFAGRKIVLLHAFLKSSEKTPLSGIRIARANYEAYLQSQSETEI